MAASKARQKIPNILTLFRVALIPVIMWGIIITTPPLYAQPSSVVLAPFVALIAFLIASITDFFDGYLARLWNVTSDFGRMIDPIADKLLVAGCLIAFMIITQGNGLITLPAMMIISRDILVSGAREYAAHKSRIMPPTKLAKWKTACEMLAITLLLLALQYGSWLDIDIASMVWSAGTIILILAAILSLYTGSLYIKAALKA